MISTQGNWTGRIFNGWQTGSNEYYSMNRFVTDDIGSSNLS